MDAQLEPQIQRARSDLVLWNQAASPDTGAAFTVWDPKAAAGPVDQTEHEGV